MYLIKHDPVPRESEIPKSDPFPKKLNSTSWKMATISQIDAGLYSFKDLLPLFKHQQDEHGDAFIKDLVLHSNAITCLDTVILNMLGSLTVLDLSSNQVMALMKTKIKKAVEHG